MSAEWCQSHKGIKEENLSVVRIKLLSPVAASAGFERVFSSYGLAWPYRPGGCPPPHVTNQLTKSGRYFVSVGQKIGQLN